MKNRLEAEVKGLGKIYGVEAPFDEALNSLKSVNAGIISLRDLAYARIKEGKDSYISKNGSYVKEGVIYTQKEILFVSNSPIIGNAREATQCHRQGKEFYIPEKQADKYKEQAEQNKKKEPQKRDILISKKSEDYSIPTNRFKDEELTLWAFRDKAEEYGAFLKEAGIDGMSVYFSNQEKQPFVRQLWLHWLDVFGSDLGGGRGLYFGDWAVGVSKRTGEVCSQKFPYSSGDIDKALKIINEVKQGNLPNSKLEKIVDFLETLRN